VTSPSLALERVLVRAVESASSFDDALRVAVASLGAANPRYHWVGIYLLRDDALVLHNQVGAPTPHVKIALSQGLCGAAARERRTIVVDDVREDPRYLACSLATRSEIVVPILAGEGRLLGEIDVDSDELAAFGPDDQGLLETVAAALAARFGG
jgi:GAF domain-containing protein